ncbi:MAG: hypothetical protein E7652_06905 [Ruminococcaceae bacterium]|nr:hypothetical protein [Oscillospiraceae bacterium]
MFDFITDFLIISGIMSVVILVMLLCSPYMKRLRASTRYLIWMFIIIRMCIPVGLSSLPELITIPIEDVSIVEQEGIAKSVKLESDKVLKVPDPIYSSTVYSEKSGKVISEPSVNTLEDAEEKSTEKSITEEELAKLIFFVWLVGAVMFLYVNLIRYARNVRILNRNLVIPEKDIIEIYRSKCLEMGMKKQPELYISSVVKSPMAYGIFKSKVVLPDMDLASSDILRVLSHEIVHCKRRDLTVKLIALIANSVQWFNPFAYIASRKLFEDMELSCDEIVLCNADKQERVSYGVAMLEIVKKCRHSAPFLTTGFNPKRGAVKKRFENILDTSHKRRGYGVLALILAVCIICGSLIGCETKSKVKSKDDSVETEKITEKNVGFKENDVEAAEAQKGIDAKDIQPFYDAMDYSMESLGVSLMTTDEGQFLIDYEGEIVAELPESEYEYRYCSVCSYITDHLTFVDPFTYEIKSGVLGHGGGNGHYIYDTGNNMIYECQLDSYIRVENIDFAVVSEGIPVDGEEAEGSDFDSELYYDALDGTMYYSIYTYRETGRYALVYDGELITDFVYEDYAEHDRYGIAAMKKDGKWGYYNHRGEMILDHIYDSAEVEVMDDFGDIHEVPYLSSGGVITLRLDDKWGYADTEGNLITDFEYDLARPVCMGKAWVKDEHGWRVVEFNMTEGGLSTAEAIEIADGYLEDYYSLETELSWKLVFEAEEEYYSTSGYRITAYINGEDSFSFTNELFVSMDKSVYRIPSAATYLETENIFEDE